jgi:hypothetical protein
MIYVYDTETRTTADVDKRVARKNISKFYLKFVFVWSWLAL